MVTEEEGISVTSAEVNGFTVSELRFPKSYVQPPFEPELPLNVYDGNRAKIGGIVTQSSDPTIAIGMFGWFQAFDNGEDANAPPDQSSLVGFGNDAANEAFCNSPNLPRFGPWDVQGNVQVRTS